MAELLSSGIVVERDGGRAKFRHALTRQALYADVPWLQRRVLHRRLAAELEATGAKAMEVATHWLQARHETEARDALLRAAEESRAVHAYRDAARAGRRALELWPEGEDEARRVETLQSYANSAELGGELAEAARAWREICAIRQAEQGTGEAYAAAQSRLAAVHDMRGDREVALAARAAAAEAYAATGQHAEAAVERLAMANYLRFAARHSEAIELAQAAVKDAEQAKRLDLRARALGLEGVAKAKRGEYEDGLKTVRAGLTLALEHDLTPVAAELYQRLSVVLYDSADYRRAQETLESALELCRAADEPVTEVACVTCMVYVLRECGEWAEALKLGRELIDSGTAVWVAEGILGVIYVAQGKLSAARRMLSSSLATASHVDHYNMTVDAITGLAQVAAIEGDAQQTAERCRSLLALWESSEDHHYAIQGLRFSAGFFSREGDLAQAQACAEALARISSETGHTDALAALASAIGETALATGDAETAAEQLAHAVRLHRSLDLPYERAQLELRAGVALAASGEKELALERLGDAYRTAKKLGAQTARGGGGRQGCRARRVDREASWDPGGRRRQQRRPVSPRAGGGATRGRGPHQPRDRAGALPQPAHRGHARPQRPPENGLPLARRGSATGRRTRPAGTLLSRPGRYFAHGVRATLLLRRRGDCGGILTSQGPRRNADERTRTSTGLPPRRPERRASTNSATSAGPPNLSGGHQRFAPPCGAVRASGARVWERTSMATLRASGKLRFRAAIV